MGQRGNPPAAGEGERKFVEQMRLVNALCRVYRDGDGVSLMSAVEGRSSTFTWLAYSDQELRRAHDLASSLSERETRDELGIGSIRDGIADRLFPGTSTIQSRARYFLFLPWLFREIEHLNTGRSRERSERAERELIAALRHSDDTRGLVGGRTSLVERLPSEIYWSGLSVLGIRRVDQSLSAYYRWLDDPRRHARLVRDDDGLPVAGAVRTWWDRVPDPPAGFPEVSAFSLTRTESEYLAARAIAATPYETLLGFLLDRGSVHPDVELPWQHPQRTGMPDSVRDDLDVAERFSLLHRGAALLYNLLIAEAREDTARCDEYRAKLTSWQDSNSASLDAFDLGRVWTLAPRASTRAKDFVRNWKRLATRDDGRALAEVRSARSLIQGQEIRVKGSQRSRITNPFRVGWNGASGPRSLIFAGDRRCSGSRWTSRKDETVLEPKSMRVLHDALQAPNGYRLDQLVATTFTLDLVSLLSVPLALTQFAGTGDEDSTDLDPLALLASVQRQAGRIIVFHQADKIAVPDRHRGLLPLIEDTLVPVRPPARGGVFHPKLWVARYVDQDENRTYRLLCLSRNLTADRCWDTILSLEGTPTRAQRSESKPLSVFVAWLARHGRLTREQSARVRSLARELSSVRFAPPAGFQHVRFHPLGIDGYRQDPIAAARRVRVLIVSPFVGADQVARLCNGAREAILVTRPEEVGLIEGAIPSNVSKILRLDDALEAEPDESSSASPWLAGLHAKLYVADQGWNATMWTGSANATSAGFGSNIEFLIALSGKKSVCGIDKVLGDGAAGSFSSMLVPCDDEALPPEDDPLERRFEALARQVAEFPVEVRVAKADDGWSLELVGTKVRTLDGVNVALAPLVADRPAQDLTLSTPIRIAFRGLKATEVSGLFEAVLHLDDEPNADFRFVVCWPLVGAIPDRVHALLMELARDPERALAFIRLFLVGDETSGLLTSPTAGSGDGRWGSGGAESAVLELLVRTLAREPARLDELARWIPDLAAAADDGAGADLLRIWNPIWQARQELQV